METKRTILISVIITAIVFGGAGYFFGKRAVSAQGVGQRGEFGMRSAQGGQMGGNRIGRTGTGGGVVAGEILSMDDRSLSVKLRDGGSKVVFFATSTSVMRTATGTIGELSVGGQVVIMGSQNADGSVTAESIQLRPLGAPIQGTMPR